MVEIPFDNIRGLVQDFVLQLDSRLVDFRAGTAYAKARQSDIRMFISASRAPKTIAELAREHHVSRQAVQSSVKRLMALEVVELLPKPGSARDKVVAVTQRGLHAKQAAMDYIGQIEREMSDILGPQGLQQFRTLLTALVLGLKARRAVSATPDDALYATGK